MAWVSGLSRRRFAQGAFRGPRSIATGRRHLSKDLPSEPRSASIGCRRNRLQTRLDHAFSGNDRPRSSRGTRGPKGASQRCCRCTEGRRSPKRPAGIQSADAPCPCPDRGPALSLTADSMLLRKSARRKPHRAMTRRTRGRRTKSPNFSLSFGAFTCRGLGTSHASALGIAGEPL
jgi:hypothetical protein